MTSESIINWDRPRSGTEHRRSVENGLVYGACHACQCYLNSYDDVKRHYESMEHCETLRSCLEDVHRSLALVGDHWGAEWRCNTCCGRE